MPFQRGEIIEVNFPLPGGELQPHPVVVISNNDINDNEDAFICVMCSSSTVDDDYTFWLSNDMLSNPTLLRTQVRCHLIALADNNDVLNRRSRLNQTHFENLINKICADVLQ